MSVYHAPQSQNFSLKSSLHKERHLLENVNIPIVTVSSTFLDAFPNQEPRHHTEEIVYSRAHYSQAIACLIAASRLNKSAWLVDPTNYVSAADWYKVLLTEKIAETLVRSELLMKVRKLIESKARDHLPIHDAIKESLLYVTTRVKKPILSMHYETANILVQNDQSVLSVVTDPFVRHPYLVHKNNPNLYFAVFDHDTKDELIQKARLENIASRVFVTGPPVDPRIIDLRSKKSAQQVNSRSLRLSITTGGTGTNKPEIKQILNSLIPRIKGRETTLQLLLYAGTHPDFQRIYGNFAKDCGIKPGKLSDQNARIRIIYNQHLMQANQLLIKYMFPWTDAVLCKPSGDMAYDAAAAGCGLIFLNPLGSWEEAIQKRFTKLKVGTDLPNPENFANQLVQLEKQWIPQAIHNALTLPSLYLQGASNIIKAMKQVKHCK